MASDFSFQTMLRTDEPDKKITGRCVKATRSPKGQRPPTPTPGPAPLPRAPSRNVPKGYSRPRSRRERSEPSRCAATGWGGPAPGSSCDRSACIRETWRDPLEGAQEGNRAGAGGGERLNVRIRFNQCPPARRPVLGPAAPQQPPGGGRRAVGAEAEAPLGGGWRGWRGRRGWRGGGFTCDGQGPAVELHGVVERRGHRVQDAARLRVQEPHPGRERAPAATRRESGDPAGGLASAAAAGGPPSPASPPV